MTKTNKQAVTFQDFNLAPQILSGVEAAGFQVPSPIQAAAIPVVLSGRDLIGQAQTGTGKTAAFGLPAMSMLAHDGTVEVLVIAPTRELANQISDELFRLGRFADVHTVAIYGGSSYFRQLQRIERGAQVVVATPGRLLDLLSGQRIPNFKPKIVILDEADEMLDMGFLEDIEKIFEYLPTERQTLLFSATMPKAIKKLADNLLKNPAHIQAGTSGEVTADNITQQYYVIEEHERDDAILRLMDGLEPEKSIVFCRTKAEVDRLSGMLEAQGFMAKGLHGDMDQRQREQTIGAFRKGIVGILVATDVAARGLDVQDVTHVFNYHLPFDTESYVHRIGRTGRAGKVGVALTLVTPREFRGIERILRDVSKLTPKEVPTGSFVRRNALEKLRLTLQEQKIDPGAEALLEAMSADNDAKAVALKAISTLLAGEQRRGPEYIGLSQKEINRLLERGKQMRNDNHRQGRWRPRGGPGGGKRFGGGPNKSVRFSGPKKKFRD